MIFMGSINGFFDSTDELEPVCLLGAGGSEGKLTAILAEVVG